MMKITEILNETQQKKLIHIFQYTNKNNIFFKEIYRQEEIDLNSPLENIMGRLPLITKKEIRANYDKYISLTEEKKIGELTSGTTGTPVNCLKTTSERITASLNVWKQRRLWDPQVNVKNYISLYDISTYRKAGNLLNLEKENVQKCFANILKISPRWIAGPVSTFERYARMINNGELEYPCGRIKFIELMGEYADLEKRKLIEKSFGCPTINHYGTMESWCIAYECPQGQMHVQNDLIYAETVNEGKIQGEKTTGEIVITSLYNKLMPLIRYNLQDLGKVDYRTCSCGQTSQIITLYGGRTGDMIAGQKSIHGEIFFKRGVYKIINRGKDCIEAFRVEQIDPDHFKFFIVPNNDYTGEVTELLKKYIKKGLGDVFVEFLFVPAIPPLPSGKIKIFKSFVPGTEKKE